jgi:hypothetical protein
MRGVLMADHDPDVNDATNGKITRFETGQA